MTQIGLRIDPPTELVSVDLPHALLLLGIVLSMKPCNVLELGYGAGYTSRVIITGLEWNGSGRLTIVDNWCDWHGQEPDTTLIRSRGATIVTSGEREFLIGSPSAKYDILVSDADHLHSQEWLSEHLRVVRPGGILFFHDVGRGSDFPNLKAIPGRLDALDIPFRLFDFDSRSDERCSRGWIMALKP